MVKVTWNGWMDHPTEKLPEAYEFLTGQNLKPTYKVFSTPEDDQPDHMPEFLEQNEEQTK